MRVPYARLLLDSHKTIETRTENKLKNGVRYSVVVSASAPWSNVFQEINQFPAGHVIGYAWFTEEVIKYNNKKRW